MSDHIASSYSGAGLLGSKKRTKNNGFANEQRLSHCCDVVGGGRAGAEGSMNLGESYYCCCF